LEKLEHWPERVKKMQYNWIGRSEGVEIDFDIEGSHKKLRVFTTRPDTIFGVTFMAIAPEHPLVEEFLASETDNRKAQMEAFVQRALQQGEIARGAVTVEKEGFFTGTLCDQPHQRRKSPHLYRQLCLDGVRHRGDHGGAGSHARDFEFAQKYGLEIRQVIDGSVLPQALRDEERWESEGRPGRPTAAPLRG
jgi:leucyl-tRNA synthetase